LSREKKVPKENPELPNDLILTEKSGACFSSLGLFWAISLSGIGLEIAAWGARFGVGGGQIRMLRKNSDYGPF
jgi:hypothetical protein